MTEQPNPVTSFDVAASQPPVGVPLEENGQEVVRCFPDEAAADQALAKRQARDGRHLAGVWKDLDWEEFADELDRIRHESKPTPPIELDL